MNDKEVLREPYDAESHPVDQYHQNYSTRPSQTPSSYFPEPPPPYFPNSPEYPLQAIIGVRKNSANIESNPMQAAVNPVPSAPPTVVPVHVVQVVQAPPSTNLTVLYRDNVRITCPKCRADITTEVTTGHTCCAYVSCICLFLLGCVLGCCLIPCCMDSCKTSKHYCSNCKKLIGRYPPS